MENAKFGGIFDQILGGFNAGVRAIPVISNLISQISGHGGGGTKITGSSIAPAANQILEQARNVLSAIQGGQVPANQIPNVVATTHTLLISLFDSNIFDTDTGHSTLVPFQNQAVALGQQIQTAADAVLAGQIPVSGTVTNPVTGAVTTNPVIGNVANDLLSSPIVLYGGMALIVIYLLKEQRQ